MRAGNYKLRAETENKKFGAGAVKYKLGLGARAENHGPGNTTTLGRVTF